MKQIFTLLILWFSAQLFAQDITVRLSASKTQVRVGEQFSVELAASENGSGDVQFPSSFQILGRMSGSNTQIINGNVSQEVTRTYTLICNQAGTYEIPPVTWNYGTNKKAKSNSLKITVGAGGTTPSNGLPSDVNSKEPHFGMFSTSKKEVYVGEPFVISGKVYFDGHIVDVNSYQISAADLSIHKTDVFGKTNQLTVEREQFGSKYYETILFFEDLVVPQQSGVLNLDPFSINIGYQRNFFNTAFVGVKSNALSIKILPLPDNAPLGFKGALGQFNVQSKTDVQKKLQVGDVFTLTIKVEGKGNIHLLKPLELNLPKGLVLYGEPTIDNQVFTTKKGAHGHLDYEYIIQVTESGNYNFEPLEFAYFNPETKSYKSIDVKPISFEAIGEGVAYKDTTTNISKNSEEGLFSSMLGILATIFLVLIFAVIAVILLLRKRNKPQYIQKPKVDAHKIALAALNEIPTQDLNTTLGAIERISLQFFRDLTQNENLFLNNDWFAEAATKGTLNTVVAEKWRAHYADIQAMKYANIGDESAESVVERTRELVGETSTA
jgi:hypothetical protein